MNKQTLFATMTLAACASLACAFDPETVRSAADLVHVDTTPSSVRADALSRMRIDVHADADSLKPDLPVTVTASRGKLAAIGTAPSSSGSSSFQGKLDPTGALSLDLVSDQSIGDGELGVTVGSLTVSASYSFTPSLPTVAPVLQTAKTTLHVGGTDSSTVSLSLLRPAGTGLVSSGLPVSVSVLPADLLLFPSTIVGNEQGVATALVSSGAILGTGTISFSTALDDGTIGSSSLTFRVVP